MNFRSQQTRHAALALLGISVLVSGCDHKNRTVRSALAEYPQSSPEAPIPPLLPPGSRPVLQPGDLNFLGFIRFSKQAGNMWYADIGLGMRRVNGQLRLFTTGNRTQGSPLLEFTVPEDAPSTTMSQAPEAPLYRNWGDIRKDHVVVNGNVAYVSGGYYWDEAKKVLWWSYGDIYVPNYHHPTIGATILNDTTGVAQSYGPWRTEWLPQRTRGNFVQIPPSFAAAYTGGAAVGIMSGLASGVATSPFGANLSAMKLPDPRTTPPDTLDGPGFTIASHGIILHDLQHRQARDTNYKLSGWVEAYDCRKGGTLRPGVPLFGGPDPGAAGYDSMHSAVWIDLPDKHGLLYFGTLVTTPEGYWAPGDPEGLVHMGYGSAFRSDGTAPNTDCYGQDDPYWGTTGPFAHWRVPHGWIYNPDDLIATATGKADLWSRTPTSVFQLRKYAPQLKERYRGSLGGAVFDPATRRIYVLVKDHDDVTVPPNSRPSIMVFEVK